MKKLLVIGMALFVLLIAGCWPEPDQENKENQTIVIIGSDSTGWTYAVQGND